MGELFMESEGSGETLAREFGFADTEVGETERDVDVDGVSAEAARIGEQDAGLAFRDG
jgi:hypothetical protein